jgi:hypothetical protein
MSDQIHIRDEETALLVRHLARRSGLSMKEVVRSAVKQLAATDIQPQPVEDDFDGLLAADQAKLRPHAGGLNDLYDEATGLPR